MIPAYNEERFIDYVLTSVPSFVDRVYAVNDASTDRSLELMRNIAQHNGRVTIVNRHRRGGVGAAIICGHEKALEDSIDIIGVMAGDGQMDPSTLPRLLDPVVEGRADYAKGDRLSLRDYMKGMSAWRSFGNFLLTHLTRIASGYWHVSDPQNGYTAISIKMLHKLDRDRIEKGFAFENDMLIKLNIAGAKVVDVLHPAVYLGQGSKIKYSHFILKTSWILLKGFIWRIWVKYIRGNSMKTPTRGSNA